MVNQIASAETEVVGELDQEKALDRARRILAVAYEEAAAHDPDPSVTALLAIGHGIIALTEEVAAVRHAIVNSGPS